MTEFKTEIEKILADFDDCAFDFMGKLTWNEIKSKYADKILQLFEQAIDSAEDDIKTEIDRSYAGSYYLNSKNIINIIKGKGVSNEICN